MKDLNHTDCECAVCRDGLEAVEARERQAIEELGWYAHFVPNDPDYPYGVNYHTHGFEESFGHLDMQICLPIHPNMAHGILSIAVEKIKAGFKFEHGEKYEDLIEAKDPSLKYEVLMLEAEECDRKVLRLIMPDKAGKFDGELAAQMEGCDNI